MMDSMVSGIDVSENGLALDALREAGLASISLAQAIHKPILKLRSGALLWPITPLLNSGTVTGAWNRSSRAAKAIDMLAAYEAPAIDPAIDEALIAYMDKRKSELPDSEY